MKGLRGFAEFVSECLLEFSAQIIAIPLDRGSIEMIQAAVIFVAALACVPKPEGHEAPSAFGNPPRESAVTHIGGEFQQGVWIDGFVYDLPGHDGGEFARIGDILHTDFAAMIRGFRECGQWAGECLRSH